MAPMSNETPAKAPTNWTKILLIGCGFVFVLTFVCGVFSAIAIPNFIKMQEKAAQFQQSGAKIYIEE